MRQPLVITDIPLRQFNCRSSHHGVFSLLLHLHNVYITSKWEYRAGITDKTQRQVTALRFYLSSKTVKSLRSSGTKGEFTSCPSKSWQTTLRWRGFSLQKSQSSLKPCIATVNAAMESSWCSMYDYLQVTLCFIWTGRLHYCCCFAVHLVNLN